MGLALFIIEVMLTHILKLRHKLRGNWFYESTNLNIGFR
jgi:hypothetical protein